jgi:integrase
MATQPHDPNDIGSFRKIRLKVNAKGYYEVWWTDAAAGYSTKRESCRTKVGYEADAYLIAFCDTARTQTQVAQTAQAPTVEDLCGRWLTHVAPLGKDKNTRFVLTGVRRHLGRHPVDRLDPIILQDYPRLRGVSNGSIRRELGALRTVLLWAAKQRLISRDDIPSFDNCIPPAGAPRSRFLDPAQEKTFWDAAMIWPDRRVKLFVALAVETAARRGAIIDLTWDRVDLALGLIDYRVPGARPTNKRRVRVPISDRLMPVLKEAWLQGHQGRVLGHDSPDSISRGFARFARSTGLPWVTPHVLRHTWGSLKAMKGAPLFDIAQVMGDTIATIEATYLHLTPDHLRRVVNF